MEVDSWGVCKINDRRKVPEHLRIIKSTTPKKPVAGMIFLQDWKKKLPSWMLADKPSECKMCGPC